MMTTRRDGDECDREQQAVGTQWRRGVRSGEDTEPASMKPWLRSHGKRCRPRVQSPGRSLASMRPWLCSHGRTTAAGRPCCRRACFNGAVASQPRKGNTTRRLAVPSLSLQWGRGFGATEGEISGSTAGKLRCFNGAVASQPRKARTSRRHGPWQCCFNGAVALQPRKGKSPAGSCRPVTRFNGAVALLPRKGHASGLPRKSFGALQWGRGFAATDGESFR